MAVSDLIQPAVKGMLRVLLNTGTSLSIPINTHPHSISSSMKCVIVMSPCAAVSAVSAEFPDSRVSEFDWNDQAIKKVHEKADWYQTVLTPSALPEKVKTGNCWIAVRDFALEREEAYEERIVISQGSYIWQDWHILLSVNAVNTLPESTLSSHANQTIPRGNPTYVKSTSHIANNTSKAARVLGMAQSCLDRGETELCCVERAGGVHRGWWTCNIKAPSTDRENSEISTAWANVGSRGGEA
ncbi:hypothetical protein FIBSPDRAFT_938442 [Athelia psychrophila]|uniref:Uncharacterized protein n=1 Tax=Athelia psychrophila TaxID=1759441 RepID=A0A165YF17_9AGAM|nr:hypothetical protein FIBSPDRAFT_938442 [Fibularhizoctonia sp. CBS 109695]